MGTLVRSFVATLVVCVAASAGAAPIPLHQYQLNGTLDDDFAGPSLTANGGTLTATEYVFGLGEGLSLENAISALDYTIVLDFAFNNVIGYNKIIDFADLTMDEGLYAFDGTMHFYPDAISPPIVPSGTQVQMALTRDGGTGEVRGYLDGLLQFSFIDVDSYAVFSGPNNILHLFIDDTTTDQEEVAPGWVDMIRIWDGALSDEDVLSLVPIPEPDPDPELTPVPEPSTLVVFGGGLIATAALLRRRAPATRV